jgi:hypothetical protein
MPSQLPSAKTVAMRAPRIDDDGLTWALEYICDFAAPDGYPA